MTDHAGDRTLRELLEELTALPEPLCRHIGLEVAKGLAVLHEAGVVHRDLKPENVLITPDHEVKIRDLGLAQLADEIPQSGAFVGTILYAAPEQFLGGGEDMDGRTDLYALGLILYEISCGMHPLASEDTGEAIRRVLQEEPRPLRERNPQVSSFFEEVVHTLLEKEPERRFPSAKELIRALE